MFWESLSEVLENPLVLICFGWVAGIWTYYIISWFLGRLKKGENYE